MRRLKVRPGADETKKTAIVGQWYRNQIREAVPALIAKWGPLMGVSVQRIFIQKMRTKWGSCNRHCRHIRLNTDLAKKPPEYLEYIVLHEMVHLLEPTHTARFVALMARSCPHGGIAGSNSINCRCVMRIGAAESAFVRHPSVFRALGIFSLGGDEDHNESRKPVS
jgi:predicted metal-dependent hydrolase